MKTHFLLSHSGRKGSAWPGQADALGKFVPLSALSPPTTPPVGAQPT